MSSLVVKMCSEFGLYSFIKLSGTWHLILKVSEFTIYEEFPDLFRLWHTSVFSGLLIGVKVLGFCIVQFDGTTRILRDVPLSIVNKIMVNR